MNHEKYSKIKASSATSKYEIYMKNFYTNSFQLQNIANDIFSALVQKLRIGRILSIFPSSFL